MCVFEYICHPNHFQIVIQDDSDSGSKLVRGEGGKGEGGRTEEESRCSSVKKKRHLLLRTPVAGEGTCICVQTQSSLRIHVSLDFSNAYRRIQPSPLLRAVTQSLHVHVCYMYVVRSILSDSVGRILM